MKKEARVKNKEDVASLLSKIHQNGGDFWATQDNGIGKGSPFSTKEVAIKFHELGYKRRDPIIQNIANTIFNTWQDDGRFKVAPSGAIYPCHTIGCVRALCYLGYSRDKRIKRSLKHLIEIQHEDGGWHCNKHSFGRGPETSHSNPGPTLEGLDAFRYTDLINSVSRLNKAVEFLLWHWKFKKPAGPCHYGIGSLFMKTEFPFSRYNLFYFCYVLSFYERARNDKRFNEAMTLLNTKLENEKMVVENPDRQILTMNFCRKGQPSDVATTRYRELMGNLRT